MKRKIQSALGVTLLEIMLVLATAAMIIVMSVRYYQSATAAQNANSVLQQLQAVAASMDALSQGSGSYSGYGTTQVKPLLANVGGLSTPWGGTITVTNGAVNTYDVTLDSVPDSICGLIAGRLAGDPTKHYSVTTNCVGNTLMYTYTKNPATSTP